MFTLLHRLALFLRANRCEINEKELNFLALGSSTLLPAATVFYNTRRTWNYRHALRSQRNDTLRGRCRNKGADVDANRSFVRWLFRIAKSITLHETWRHRDRRCRSTFNSRDFTGYLFTPRACTSSNDKRIARLRRAIFLKLNSSRNMSLTEMIFYTRYFQNSNFNNLIFNNFDISFSFFVSFLNNL